MSCLLRVKRPSLAQEVVKRRTGRLYNALDHLGPTTSGQFIPSQLDFTVRAACNRRGAAFSTLSTRQYVRRYTGKCVMGSPQPMNILTYARENRYPFEMEESVPSLELSFCHVLNDLSTRTLAFSHLPEANAIPVLLPRSALKM